MMGLRLPFRNLPPGAWSRLANAAVFTAVALALAAVAWDAYASGGQDFRGYYAGARVVATGGDPYDYHLFSQELVRATGQWTDHRFYYPPWLALLLLPLAYLPYDAARLVWLCANLGFLLAALLVIRDALGWPPLDWRGGLVMLSVCYPLAWIALRSEQITLAMLLCLAVATWALARRRDALAGVALAFLLTKPNVTFLPVALLGLYALRQRRWPTILAFVGATTALLVTSSLVMPNWWRQVADVQYGQGLWQQLSETETITAVRVHATLQTWLAGLGLAAWALLPAYAAAVLPAIALAWCAWRSTAGPLWLAAWGGVAGLMLTPYAYEYDYILMAPAVVLLWRSTTRLRGWRLMADASLWFAFYTIHLWAHWMNEMYWMPLILFALSFINFGRWNDWPLPAGTRSDHGYLAIDGDASSAHPPYPFRP